MSEVTIHCDPHRHGNTPDVLRNIARLEIGGNAPWLADELTDLADRLEREMNGTSTYRDPGSDIVRALIPWAKRNGIDPDALAALLNLALLQQVVLAAESEDPREMETFGQRIKRRRREFGLTQRQVAEMLHIDFTYLSKLENDRGEPPGEKTIRKLSVELQEDEEELLALAGKVPEQLRDRAQQDVAFARLVRRLPDLPDSQLQDIYRSLNINRERTGCSDDR